MANSCPSNNGHKKVVELLLDHGANPYVVDTTSRIPFDLAKKKSIQDCLVGGRISEWSCSRPSVSRLPNALTDDLDTLVNNRKHSDIVFDVAGKDVFGHKCILGARSEFFRV
jgi:hypothetical protein